MTLEEEMPNGRQDTYTLTGLTIENPRNSRKIFIEPQGCMIMGAHGRVEIRGFGSDPIVLLRPIEGEGWLIRQGQSGRALFTKEVFEDLLLKAYR